MPCFTEGKTNSRKSAAGEENRNYWLWALHFAIVNSLFKLNFYVCCLLADENIMCREQLRTASGTAMLRSRGWDAAVGASRPEFCSASSTDSLPNFCSSQLNLSSSSSSFCRAAPGNICSPFSKHVEIYRWKTANIWSIKVPTFLKICTRKDAEDGLMKTNWMCTATAKPWFSNRVVPRVLIYEQSWSGTVLWIRTQTSKHVKSKISDPVNLSFTQKVNTEYTNTKAWPWMSVQDANTDSKQD